MSPESELLIGDDARATREIEEEGIETLTKRQAWPNLTSLRELLC